MRTTSQAHFTTNSRPLGCQLPMRPASAGLLLLLSLAGCAPSAQQRTAGPVPIPQPQQAAPTPSGHALALSLRSRASSDRTESDPLSLLAAPSEPPTSSGHEPTTPNASRVTFTVDSGADFDPSVSHDAQSLVYASTAHRENPDIFIKHIGSRVTTQLTSDPAQDLMPRLSPDGSMIAFASDRGGNWDIYVMPTTGGRALQVTDSPEHEIAPSWSSDGRRLAYSRLGATSGRWEMWLATLASPQTASFIGFGLFPQWCPTPAAGAGGAERIVYQLGRERGNRAFSIWTIDIAGDGRSPGKAGHATLLASDPDAALINPAWSPDGQWIVYARVPLDQHASHTLLSGEHAASLWMMSASGEGSLRLTSGPASALSPTWASDQRLYFVSSANPASLDATDNIWSIDMQTTVRTASLALNPRGVGAAPALAMPTSPPMDEQPHAHEELAEEMDEMEAQDDLATVPDPH